MDNNKDLTPLYLYAAFYVEYFIVIVMELQLLTLIQIPYYGLRFINANLHQLLKDLTEKEVKPLTKLPLFIKAGAQVSRRVPPGVNLLIDSLAASQGIKLYDAEQQSHATCLKLHILSGSYLEICNMIQIINDRNGTMFLFMLLLFFLDLVINSYYWIMSLLTIKYRSTDLGLETAWCIFHAFNIVFVLEPCNKTQSEIDRTCSLVSSLINKTATDKVVSAELDKFLIFLTLNKPTTINISRQTYDRHNTPHSKDRPVAPPTTK
ncbi:gustatory receptor for sugar taste 43a-like [Battus philenor]|uniref:gustatory receptor for sugar taste 43a-like n=1 Tax=Battus philenor TaxID=42288 RepID=UPI0035D0C0F6